VLIPTARLFATFAQTWVFAVIGSASHQFKLAGIYYRAEGVRQDLSKAVTWYQRAARLGHGPAEHLLGTFYVAGLGLSKDYDQAFELFKRAAEHGDLAGRHALGWCHQQGIGTEKNLEAAFANWLDAANGGFTNSQWAVADAYFRESGVSKNLLKAQEWCHLAIRSGADAEANELLAEIQETLLSGAVSPQQIVPG